MHVTNNACDPIRACNAGRDPETLHHKSVEYVKHKPTTKIAGTTHIGVRATNPKDCNSTIAKPATGPIDSVNQNRAPRIWLETAVRTCAENIPVHRRAPEPP